jgi:V-type H+-transporting ATPase subunit A
VSYSKYLKVLDPHYEKHNPGFIELRTRAKEILQKENDLAEIVQLVGKSALGESDKITLEVARMLKDDFLQQNGISEYDRYCPFSKTAGMLRNFVAYFDGCQRAVETEDLTFAKIRDATSDIMYKLSQMKFESPNSQSEDEIAGKFDQLHTEIQEAFRRLQE